VNGRLYYATGEQICYTVIYYDYYSCTSYNTSGSSFGHILIGTHLQPASARHNERLPQSNAVRITHTTHPRHTEGDKLYATCTNRSDIHVISIAADSDFMTRLAVWTFFDGELSPNGTRCALSYLFDPCTHSRTHTPTAPTNTHNTPNT
jgi:hypothetical protein